MLLSMSRLLSKSKAREALKDAVCGTWLRALGIGLSGCWGDHV